MIKLTNITSSSLQTFTFTTEDKTDVTMTMRYMSSQLGWIANISDSNGFTVNGIALIASPNLLREFKEIIGYGIAITSVTGYDPRNIDSFFSESAIMYVLSNSEVEEIERQIYEQV